MSGSVNKAIIVGNLGQDPEFTQTQDGRRFGRLSVATSERWTNKGSGEKQERTEWHRVAIFNEHLVDIAERFLRKGSKVYLEGQIQTRKWQDQSGQDRYSTEIALRPFGGQLTLLDSKSDGGQSGGGQSDSGGYGSGGRPSDGLDDQIPFAPETRI